MHEKIRMVFNKICENSKENYKKSDGNIKKRIFTCEEIEGSRRSSVKRLGIQKQIKHVEDPAILYFSSSENMTRYDKADLITLKDGKMSQNPPECFYNPEIIRLNILKYQSSHTQKIEDEMKVFREKLQNLTLASWDPNILQLLRNYHNALLNPFYNSYAANFQPTQQQQLPSPERVSFTDNQQAVLDKIPSYDRNLNFFDNITTTATMRPPRMGVNSFNNNHNNNNGNNYYKQRPNQHNNNLRKPNSCANEYVNSYSSSAGYFSENDTKLSCEESLLDKPCEKRAPFDFKKKMESNVNSKKVDEEEEKEPEWFSVPATLEDFIDLHGFDDEEDNNADSKEVNGHCEFKQPTDGQKNSINNNFQTNDYQSNQNRRYNPNNSYNRYATNGYNNNRNMSYRPNYQAQNYNAMNNGNQRFRNPLHFAKPQRTPAPPIVNPFFEAWRNGKFLNQRNVSFTDMMEQNGLPRNIPPNAVHMSDIENQMKQYQNCSFISQQPQAQPAAVPQFFQNLANNWGVRLNEIPNNAYQPHNIGPPPIREGYQMPTQEQLQQFTSEIMRNAILRKNQQHRDENNYQK